MEQVTKLLESERSSMGQIMQNESLKLHQAYEEELARRTNEMSQRVAAMELSAQQAHRSKEHAEHLASVLLVAERTREQAVFSTPVNVQRFELSPKKGGEDQFMSQIPSQTIPSSPVFATPTGVAPRQPVFGLSPSQGDDRDKAPRRVSGSNEPTPVQVAKKSAWTKARVGA